MKRALFALVLIGCSGAPGGSGGDDTGGGDDVVVDAGDIGVDDSGGGGGGDVDGGVPTGPIDVTIETLRTPTFIAYRRGTGAWIRPTLDGAGRFVITGVAGPYEVAVTCFEERTVLFNTLRVSST